MDILSVSRDIRSRYSLSLQDGGTNRGKLPEIGWQDEWILTIQRLLPAYQWQSVFKPSAFKMSIMSEMRLSDD
jgi:hypothetical protein